MRKWWKYNNTIWDQLYNHKCPRIFLKNQGHYLGAFTGQWRSYIGNKKFKVSMEASWQNILTYHVRIQKKKNLTKQRYSKFQVIFIKNEVVMAFLMILYFFIMFLGHLQKTSNFGHISKFKISMEACWQNSCKYHVDIWIFSQKKLVQFKLFSYKMKRSYIEFEYKFYIFPIRPMFEFILFIYWPPPPNNPQGIRVASVIEFSVCLFVCLFILSKFSNFYTVQYSRVQYSTV